MVSIPSFSLFANIAKSSSCIFASSELAGVDCNTIAKVATGKLVRKANPFVANGVKLLH